ncbi:IS3 family transposase [Enterococcus sp. AZ194]|uniref:IS3 family transposase n=1 Tax=Enterococcus sp. AZ194 TaxID=2774629 RepID=UPI003F687087
MCRFLHVSRSAYYKWLKYPISPREFLNTELAQEIRKTYENHPDMGYRRIADTVNKQYRHKFNDKRFLRICRALRIQSTIKHWANSITRRSKRPYHMAKKLFESCLSCRKA